MSITNMRTDMSKKPATQDWHKDDIKAALRKKGYTLRGLSFANGYLCADTASQALIRSYPKVERIIAKALGVKPEEIWPSRYLHRQKSSTAFKKQADNASGAD